MWMGDCSTTTIKLHQGKTEQLQWSVQRSGVPDTGCNYMIAEAECQLAQRLVGAVLGASTTMGISSMIEGYSG